jgi:hypothetical protein
LLIPGAVAGEIAIAVTEERIVEFCGWGLMPAPYDRQLPTYADGSPAHGDAGWLPATGAESAPLHAAVCGLGFDIARVYLSPNLGRPDGTLDADRLRDLEDHLTILNRHGVRQYLINVWSPPAHMKLPDRVRYGKYNERKQQLAPDYADGQGYDLADYFADVVRRLTADGFAAPVGISIQNEPDVASSYDGCVYAETEEQREIYRRVVKQLRAKLDAIQLQSVPILVSESSGAANLEAFLGRATPDGFERLKGDAQLRAAVGGFAWHQYYTVDHVRTFRRAMTMHEGPRWMTEVAQDATPLRGDEFPATDQQDLKVAINMVRRMAADFSDFRVHYWFFWRGWHSTGGVSYPAQDLVFGDQEHPQLTKLGMLFQALWTTVRPRWNVVAVRSSDPRLRSDNEEIIEGYEPNGNMMSRGCDLAAFEDPVTSRQCLVLVNRHAESLAVRLSGLKGSTATVRTTTAAQDLAEQPPRTIEDRVMTGGPLVLPAESVTLLRTAAAPGAAGVKP